MADMPRVVDHEHRRAQIIASTRAVLARDGIEGATMRNIARQARCTTGRITHYFADKDELMIAVLRSIHRSSRQRMESVLDDGGNLLERAITTSMPLDSERRDEWAIWVTFWAHAVHSDALQAELRIRYAEWTALVAGLLGTEPESPTVTMLVASIDGLGTRIALDPNGVPDVERSVSIIVATAIAAANASATTS